MAATDYAASLERARDLQVRERADPRISSACSSIVLEHGQRVRRSIVCMHGITSSPVQFRELGELFYAKGYNVVIPRMPRHGYTDRLTHDHASLTVADFKAYATEAMEIGRGLGEHLTLAGLSVSGVLAAWCAQTRVDLDLAVAIAPAFAPYGVPLKMIPALIQLTRRLPNVFVSWDFPKPVRLTPGCSYPRFSTHALAQAFTLGTGVRQEASQSPPAARSILVVTNLGDRAVNVPATRALVHHWRAHPGTSVREYVFAPELHNVHDIIGPYQPNARVDYVYPILFDLIDKSA